MLKKKSIMVGAAIAAVTLGGLGSAGVVSAATSSSSTGSTSIADKIATKFNLDKAEVKAVFDEERAAHHAERKADQAAKLATAVKDGKLTQAQADYITNAQAEIESLRGSATPDTETDTVREQIKVKMEALHDWAATNNIDEQYVHGGQGGPGGHGGPRGNRSSSDSN